MKNIVYLMTIAGAIALIIYSCESTKEDKTDDSTSLTLTGRLTDNSSCKGFKEADSGTETPDTISCISYEFNEAENTLTLHHINAGFNCCPDSLYCEISINADTITIEEFEKESLCHCNCLYDLDIEIEGVDTKKYYLKFIEPYAGEQEKLFFNLNTEEENEGMYCVTRKLYPWGTVDYEGGPSLELTGEIINHSDCKSYKSTEANNNVSDTLSCIEYSYDVLLKELMIKHINAGFNCCPESLYCDVSVHNDTIIIEEFEQDGLCDCLCLFDLDIKLKGVDQGKYYMKIVEPYVESEELINFDLDLVNNYEGSWCVIRKNYPWGM